MIEKYPSSTTSSSIKTWPILKMAYRSMVPEDLALLNPYTRWPLQRAIADIRFKLLQEKIAQGYVGCGDEHITIIITASQKVIDSNATEGKEIRLSNDTYAYQTVTVDKEFRAW